IKIDEYVATMMPMRIANEKPRMTSPPNTNSTANTKTNVNDVMMVRLKVLFTARLTVSPMSLCLEPGLLRYSRNRSNTTTVSLIEYAITVRIAATKCWSMSMENGTIPSSNENRKRMIKASCVVDMAAARLYCHLRKR